MKKIIFPIFALFFAIFLCSEIDTYSQNFLVNNPSAKLSNQIFYKTFGDFREYLSDLSYLQADAYFHGKGQRCKKENCAKTLNEQTHQYEHHSEHISPKNETNPLLNISQAMTINKHRHLSGKEQKEILPWFYFAIKLNPHNKSAYTLGGFWLANRLNKTDEAINFLKQGLEANPNSWEIYSELGGIYIMEKKDYINGAYYFKKAKQFADKQSVDRFNKRVIYTFLAESYTKSGKDKKAQAINEELDKLFPPKK